MQIQMQLEKCQAGTRSRSGLGELHTSHTSGRQLMIGELPLPLAPINRDSNFNNIIWEAFRFVLPVLGFLKHLLLITLPLSIAFYLFLDVHGECLEI